MLWPFNSKLRTNVTFPWTYQLMSCIWTTTKYHIVVIWRLSLTHPGKKKLEYPSHLSHKPKCVFDEFDDVWRTACITLAVTSTTTTTMQTKSGYTHYFSDACDVRRARSVRDIYFFVRMCVKRTHMREVARRKRDFSFVTRPGENVGVSLLVRLRCVSRNNNETRATRWRQCPSYIHHMDCRTYKWYMHSVRRFQWYYWWSIVNLNNLSVPFVGRTYRPFIRLPLFSTSVHWRLR